MTLMTLIYSLLLSFTSLLDSWKYKVRCSSKSQVLVYIIDWASAASTSFQVHSSILVVSPQTLPWKVCRWFFIFRLQANWQMGSFIIQSRFNCFMKIYVVNFSAFASGWGVHWKILIWLNVWIVVLECSQK